MDGLARQVQPLSALKSMPPRPLLLGQRIERLQRAVGYHHLIGVRLDIGKSTVEVKEKA